jgi:AbrB family looped-hinge helix DNA binding protein
MTYTATVTSKRQLTLPAEVYQALDLKSGSKVSLTLNQSTVTLEPVAKILDRLQGSVKLPKRFQGLDIEEIIQKAKDEYFTEKYKDLIKQHDLH